MGKGQSCIWESRNTCKIGTLSIPLKFTNMLRVLLSWIDFLACRGHGHDRPCHDRPGPGLDVDPGLGVGFHWFLTLLESAVAVDTRLVDTSVAIECDQVLERIEGSAARNCG